MLRFGVQPDLRTNFREFGSDAWATALARRMNDAYAYWQVQAPGVPLNIPQPLTRIYGELDQNWLLDTYTRIYAELNQNWALATRESINITEQANFTDSTIALGRFISAITDGIILSDSAGITRTTSMSLLDGAIVSATMGMQITLTMSLVENLLMSAGIINVGDRVSWVANANTGAMSLFEGWNFNSYATIGGKFYGCDSNGIYLLEGSDDEGTAINSTITTGLEDLGTSKLKAIVKAYIGCSSSGQLHLKTITESGTENTYIIESTGSKVRESSVDIGKGLQSRYWQFTISNVGGAEFMLEDIEFVPVVLQRHR